MQNRGPRSAEILHPKIQGGVDTQDSEFLTSTYMFLRALVKLNE